MIVHVTYSAILSERIAAHFTLARGVKHYVRRVGVVIGGRAVYSYQIVRS